MENIYLISFNSTHHAIRAEKLIEEKNIKVMTIPTPREIAASCGLSIKFEFEQLPIIKIILHENDIDIRGIYLIKKSEDGKREAQLILSGEKDGN